MNPPFLFLMHAGENNFLCFSFWKHILSFWEKWDWKETIFFWLVKTCLVGILVRSCPRLNGNLQYREKGISSVKVLSHPRRHIFHIESINIFSEMGVVPELTSTLGKCRQMTTWCLVYWPMQGHVQNSLLNKRRWFSFFLLFLWLHGACADCNDAVYLNYWSPAQCLAPVPGSCGVFIVHKKSSHVGQMRF